MTAVDYREMKRNHSRILNEQAETRNQHVPIYKIPRVHKPVKTQTVVAIDEEAEKQMELHYQKTRADILR